MNKNNPLCLWIINNPLPLWIINNPLCLWIINNPLRLWHVNVYMGWCWFCSVIVWYKWAPMVYYFTFLFFINFDSTDILLVILPNNFIVHTISTSRSIFATHHRLLYTYMNEFLIIDCEQRCNSGYHLFLLCVFLVIQLYLQIA